MTEPKRKTPTQPDFEILIAGGGVIGLVAGISLARAGFHVGLISGLPSNAPAKPMRPNRAFAIGYATWRIFEALEIGQELADLACGIDHIRVNVGKLARVPTAHQPDWRAGAGHASFDAADFSHDSASAGQATLGYVIEEAPLQTMLEDLARAEPNLRIIDDQRVEICAWGASQASLTLQNGRQLSARLVLAADGANSKLRQSAPIRVYLHDFGQNAISATLSHAKPHCRQARQIFLPGGPCALLPLPDQPPGTATPAANENAGNGLIHRSSLVWSCPRAQAQALVRLGPSALQEALMPLCGASLGRFEIEPPIIQFPLARQIAAEMIAPRLALLGDAAHLVHPLAGQGLNLGLRDVASLVEILIAADRLGEDIGSAEVLGRYPRQRRADVMAMIAMTSGLHAAFANPISPLRWIGGVGLHMVGAMRPLRHFLMREAGGDHAFGQSMLRGVPLWPSTKPEPPATHISSAL